LSVASRARIFVDCVPESPQSGDIVVEKPHSYLDRPSDTVWVFSKDAWREMGGSRIVEKLVIEPRMIPSFLAAAFEESQRKLDRDLRRRRGKP